MDHKKVNRKKITLQYIRNNSTRRASFSKRLESLMKKARELSILCDVKTCVLVRGEGEAAMEVFPSHAKAVSLLTEFYSLPNLRQCKDTMNQEDLLTRSIEKLRDQVYKSRQECRDCEIKYLLLKAMQGNHADLFSLSIEELVAVGYKVNALLDGIDDKRMASFSGSDVMTPM